MVCFLVLMPLSPASTTAPFSHSWSSGWNPSFTDSHWGSRTWQGSWTGSWQHPSWTGSWNPTWSATWHPSWTNTWQHSWTNTWQTNTWQPSWTNTWTQTWHTWYTQSYPTYTWTEYGPSYPWTAPGCYPYYPNCSGYYPPYPANYNPVALTPAVSAPGGEISVRGYGLLPTDTTCTISSPATPNLIFNGTAACVIQSSTGVAIGGFIVGNVLPGNYIVQVTGNQGDFVQAIMIIE